MSGPVVYKGKTYPHLTALSKVEAVVANSTVDGRLRAGWPLEKALKTPAQKMSPANPITTYKGKTYPTFKALAKAEGVVAHQAVESRLRKGWPLEKALKTPSKNEIEYKGKTYPSLSALVEAESEVSQKVVGGRLFRGWSLEEALGHCERILERSGHETTYKGKSYPSFTALVKAESEVSLPAVYGRLAKGWSLETALETPHSKEIEYKEKTYPSLKDLVEADGVVPYETVASRINSGWPLQEALKTAFDQIVFRGTETIYNGKTYPSFAAMAKAEGVVLPKVVRSRLKLGWELDDALKTPKVYRGDRHVFTVDGKTYKSMAALARAFNLSAKNVMWRVRRGLSDHEVAYGRQRKKKSRVVKGNEIVVAGKSFPSESAAAKHFGISITTFSKRLRKGYTPEQAAELKDAPKSPKGPFGPGAGSRVLVRRKSFKSLWAAANYFDVSYHRARYRIQEYGATVEQALGLEPFSTASTIEFNGKMYESQTALAEAYGLDGELVAKRIRILGWTLEEALEIVDRETPISLGVYGEKFFEDQPEEKDRVALLYFVHVTHDASGQSVAKIGITVKDLTRRFRKDIGYSVKEITSKETTLYNAWLLEQMILEDYADYGIIWERADFGGRTECFNFSEEQISEIRQLIDEL